MSEGDAEASALDPVSARADHAPAPGPPMPNGRDAIAPGHVGSDQAPGPAPDQAPDPASDQAPDPASDQAPDPASDQAPEPASTGADAGGRRRQVAVGAAAVAVASTAGNALGYALILVGARLLSPADFGAYGALLALLTVCIVLQIGLQTVAAVRIARRDADPRQLVRVGAQCSGLAAAVLVVASPAITLALHLDSVVPVLLLAAATLPLNLVGTYLGLMQGAERFSRLALGLIAVQIGRVGGGLIGLGISRDIGVAFVGIVVGSALATIACWALARPVLHPPRAAGHPAIRQVGLAEALKASAAMLGMLAMVNADLLLARAFLPANDAGAYAVGAVLTKIAFWAPQVVTVIALPRLAKGRAGTLKIAAAAVGATGLVSVAGCAVLGDLAVRVAGGAAYSGLAPQAWLFAASGSALALVNLVVNARIATGGRWVAAPLGAAIVVEAAVVAAWTPHTLTRIISTAVTVAIVSVAINALLHRGDHAPAGQPGVGTAGQLAT